MSDDRKPMSTADRMRYASAATAGLVAVAAFVFTAGATIDYSHMVGVHLWLARGMPVFIEAAVLVGGLDIAAARLTRRPSRDQDDEHVAHRLSRWLLGFGVAASAAINGAHGYALGGATAAVLSAIPALVMPVCVHIALDQLVRTPVKPARAPRRRRPQRPPASAASSNGQRSPVAVPASAPDTNGARRNLGAAELRELLPDWDAWVAAVERAGSQAQLARDLPTDDQTLRRRKKELQRDGVPSG